MSASSSLDGMNDELMAFANDDASLAALRVWAGKQDFPASSVRPGGVEAFAQMLETSSPPKLAIVDIDGQADPVGALARLLTLCAECRIVAVGSANDVGLYRRMAKAGAADYLVKPLTNDTLSQALNAAKHGSNIHKTEAKEARLVAIIGTRGGVGASTLAVNLGWLLAHELKSKCVLLDLDLQFGTSSLALDLEPGRGLRDLVASPQRVDSLMIASSMVSESDRFAVLGAEEAVDEFMPMDSSAITALIKDMGGSHEYIIADVPRQQLAMQRRLLSMAHDIVLVTEMSLAGIRDTLRIRTALTGFGCSGAITVVASRVTGMKGQVDVPTFEKGAQVKIDLLIPEDVKTVAAAANSGKALGEVAPTAAVTKAFGTLAHKLSGATKTAPKTSSFVETLLGKLTKNANPRKAET